MDKLFKKGFFNDSSRRSAQQEKAPSPLQPPAGFHPIPNSNHGSKLNKSATENTKGQSRNTYAPEYDPSLPPSQPGIAPSSHNKAQPTLPAGQRQQQQRTRQQSLSSPHQHTQQQQQQQQSLKPSQSSPYHQTPQPQSQQQQQQQQQQQTREHSPEISNSTLGSNRNSFASSDFSLDDKQPANQQQGPPVPKHHPDLSQTSLTGGNTNDGVSAGKDKVGKKWELLASQVNTLNESKAKLEQQIKGLRLEKDQQCMDLQRQCEELQRTLKFKEDEYTKMQNNFHKHVRAIRATDDDLSTIHAKLTMLQAKASQLPMALRGSYQEKRSAEVIAYFHKRWPSLKDTLDELMLHDAATGALKTTFPGTETKATYQSKLDYPLVCLLVEKLVMEILVEHVFDSPVHLGLSVNDHYQALSDFMAGHQATDWSNKLRQQLCKIAVNANQEKVGITSAKAHVVQCLKKEIDIIYQVPPEKLVPKLTKLVELAAETSLAMHGQDEPVLFGTDLVEGQSMYNPRLMSLQFGSTVIAPLSKPGDDSKVPTKDITSDDDDDDEDDDDQSAVPTSPLPTPSLVLRVIVSRAVYAADENGISAPLLLGRVICF